MKFKTEIKWGLIFVLMTLAWLGLERLLGYHDEKINQHPVFSNLILVPAIAVYVFAFLDKRKTDYAGVMSYKQGFIFGLIMTAIVTLCVPITQSIISYLITPDYFANAIAYSVEQGEVSQEEAEQFFNLKSYIIQGMIATPIIGAATSALVAIFVRRKG